MQKTIRLGVTLGLMAVSATLFAQATVTVYSQNTAPGDLFININPQSQGSSFGHANWVYNNVRNIGAVGIRINYPRSGNGSVFLGMRIPSSGADIEYFVNPTNVGGNFYPALDPSSSMGLLQELTHLQYDWYRDATSTAQAHFHPALRIGVVLVVNNIPVRGGYLVFERVYNGLPTPTNQWVTDDIIAGNYRLWGTPALSFGNQPQTIAQWVALANSVGGQFHVVSINAGVGSGWGGNFIGAVDNIRFGFNGQYTTYNFEVVPEPASMIALGSGLVSLLALRRRRA